jgi:hypothetical protein
MTLLIWDLLKGVVTLTLGLWPKQGAYKGAGQEWAQELHFMLSKV